MVKKKENQKLVIDITESDCQDLMSGKEFDWTFTTDKGKDIDIHLYNPDSSGEYCEECEEDINTNCSCARCDKCKELDYKCECE